MPTTRTRRKRAAAIEFDDSMRLHLEIGDCLLAGEGKGCSCGLVDANGAFREDLATRAREHFGITKESIDAD